MEGDNVPDVPSNVQERSDGGATSLADGWAARTRAIQRNQAPRSFDGAPARGLQLLTLPPRYTQSSKGSGAVEAVPHSPRPRQSNVSPSKRESGPMRTTIMPLLAVRFPLVKRSSTAFDVVPYGFAKPMRL